MNEIVRRMVNKKRKVGGMHILMVRIPSFSFILVSKKKKTYLDKWIARQMEVHPDKKSVLLVAG
jgi:hypothetical protein